MTRLRTALAAYVAASDNLAFLVRRLLDEPDVDFTAVQKQVRENMDLVLELTRAKLESPDDRQIRALVREYIEARVRAEHARANAADGDPDAGVERQTMLRDRALSRLVKFLDEAPAGAPVVAPAK